WWSGGRQAFSHIAGTPFHQAGGSIPYESPGPGIPEVVSGVGAIDVLHCPAEVPGEGPNRSKLFVEQDFAMANDSTTPAIEATDPALEGQARDQAGAQQVRLRIDERNKSNFYVNAFRNSASADEVILDLGMNRVIPTARDREGKVPAGQPAADIVFDVNASVV